MDTIAGRSTPGSIFSTKCAIAIRAPVLPALTQALRIAGLDQIERAPHRGVLLAAQRLARVIGHFNDLGGEQAAHVGGICRSRRGAQAELTLADPLLGRSG